MNVLLLLVLVAAGVVHSTLYNLRHLSRAGARRQNLRGKQVVVEGVVEPGEDPVELLEFSREGLKLNLHGKRKVVTVEPEVNRRW